MRKHRAKAKELATNTNIKPLTGIQTVAGFMMLFSKQNWLKAGKFPEGAIQINNEFIDYIFCRSVLNFGKLGIAEGVYLFHHYRPDAKDTRTGYKHLLK